MSLLGRGFAVAALLASSVLAQQTPAERHRVSAPIAFYDDADVSPPGTFQISEGICYTKVPAGQNLSFSSTYVELALNPKVEIMASVSDARSSYEGTLITGMGDSYFGSKFLVVAEGKRRPGVAVEPMVEVLGPSSLAFSALAPDRVNYVLPVTFQKSFDQARVYGMAGYVTRGIAFASLVFELNRWSRVTPMVVVSGSRVTRDVGLLSELGLNRSQMDALAGASVEVHRGWSVFAMAGRSLGRKDANSTSYQLTGGLNVTFRLWGVK